MPEQMRTLQQELMSVQRELEPLRRLQASHDVALHENQSASSEIKNLQEQVGSGGVICRRTSNDRFNEEWDIDAQYDKFC